MNEVNVFCRTKRNKRFVRVTQQTIIQAFRILKKTKRAIDVFIVGDSEMKELYNKSTNVLAYPASEAFPHPDTSNKVLGELYLNPAYIKTHGENFQYCVIHGLLHLLGFDHTSRKGATRMERRETYLIKKLQNIK